ncbi:hypothetical protein C0989_002843 [Termitomyces sp. Mn162]|nr:hypothetical protein C0989_002843 [Termitomyces sp. Mn162]
MPRPNRQGFSPSNIDNFSSSTLDMYGIPLLYSHASEESEIGGGGGGYGQPANPGLQQDSYGAQAAGGGSEYVSSSPREGHRSLRGSRLPPDHGQDAFDFSALPTGQPIGYQQSHGAVGVYTPHHHSSREPHIYYTNDARTWNPSGPRRDDHNRPSTAEPLGGYYRRGGGRDIAGMPGSHQPRPSQGPPSFQLHGQRHIYTDHGRPGLYSSPPSHSAGNISPVVKPDSPASISLSSSGSESPLYQPIEDWLRENAGLIPRQPLNLWSLPDPAPGSRPNVTYKVLVSLAIWGSPNRRLSLQEIYSQIENRFPYYKNLPDETGRDGKGGGKKWQRSVRHNLSLESIFHNEGRDISEPGKGGYWSLTNRNGYGQKRERKRKSKSSYSSREFPHKQEEDDDFDDDDDEDGTHDDRPSSSRVRYSYSRPDSSSSPHYPISGGNLMTVNPSAGHSTLPAFGQTNNLGQSSRSRHLISRANSTPLPNLSELNPRMYPTRPSTVPIFEEPNYNPLGASGEEYLQDGQGHSGYGYDRMEVNDSESHRHLRGDKAKRRAS